MSIRIRVYPQTASFAAQQAVTIRTKNRQITNLRLQVQRLQAQLAAYSPAVNGYATHVSPYSYPVSPWSNAFSGAVQFGAGVSPLQPPLQLGFGSSFGDSFRRWLGGW